MAGKMVNVGLVGCRFMGKAHSNAFQRMPMFFPDAAAFPVMKALCGRNEAVVSQVARNWGWESYETSWERLIARPDIDLVDIVTPNDSHRDIAFAAAQAGKHILCEKPLAMNLEQAVEMYRAVEAAGVTHMVGFNYRRLPAVQLARQFIERGMVGKICHFRAVYLQDWIVDPEFPLVWRLDRKVAGSGPLGDLGAHIIDIARFLVGEFDEVVGLNRTFIKDRPLPSASGDSTIPGPVARGEVTVEDASLFLASFKNGAVGNFEATRFGLGNKNGQRWEINGSKGSIRFNLERLNELEFYSTEDPDFSRGFKSILVTEPVHPYAKAWWPPGHIIGYEHSFVHQVYDLMQAIALEQPIIPSFLDGVRCQEVLEAVERSVESRGWVKVEDSQK